MAEETGHFCRCCLLSENESQNPLADMKSETFVNGNKKITFSDGYADVNNFPDSDFHIPDERICEICVVQLENAYLFRNLCRVTTAILHRKYSTLGNNSKAGVDAIKSDAESDSSDQQQCDDTENQQSVSSVSTRHKKHICKNCEKSFTRRADLKYHRCGKNAFLNEHKNVENEKDSQIEHSEITENPNQSTSNVDNVDKPYKCEVCKKKFMSRNSVRRHTKETHDLNEKYNCSLCPAVFSRKEHLVLHNESQHSLDNEQKKSNKEDTEMKYQCFLCSASFNRNDNFIRHKKTKHANFVEEHTNETNDSNKKYNCYTRKYRLLLHTKSKHSLDNEQNKNADKIFQCFLCSARFSRKDGLIQHKRIKHANFVEEKCEICQQVFPTKRSLRDHERTVHSNDNFECVFCLKAFQNKSSILKHRRTAHPNACKICKIEFNSSTDLDVHSEIHPKIHECLECEQSFSYSNDLNQHKRTAHFENIQFTCDICGKHLQAYRSIKRHMLIVHLNVGYECKLCSQKYQGRNALWAHAFKHREHLPFNCNECDYRTANKSDFRNHLSRKHQVMYNESIHGYKLETVEEVIAAVQ